MDIRTKEKNNSNNILFLLCKYRNPIMGFSALWIFIFHVWSRIFTRSPLLSSIEAFISRIGYVGVDIFFFISAIGLTYSISKHKLSEYYYRRIKRIILPFIIVAIIYGLLFNWSILDYVKKLSFYNFYFLIIYDFVWFVPAIVTLYIIFPFYYNKMFIKSSNKYIFTIVFITIYVFIIKLLSSHTRIDLYGFLNRIPLFLIGILCGWMVQNNKSIHWDVACPFLFIDLVIGLLALYLTLYYNVKLLLPLPECFIPTSCIATSLPFLLAILFERFKDSSFLDKILKLLSFYGSFSLEFYLFQELVAFETKKIYVFVNNHILYNIINLIISSLLGFCLFQINKYLWLFIESKYNSNRKNASL